MNCTEIEFYSLIIFITLTHALININMSDRVLRNISISLGFQVELSERYIFIHNVANDNALLFDVCSNCKLFFVVEVK